MIPALVRLPATTLAHGDLDDLVAVATALSEDRTVLVPAQRDPSGAVLDEFVLAAAVATGAGRVGVAARVAQGRAASVLAREATAAQLLGAADVVFLEGPAPACRDAALVLAALFQPGVHTVRTPTAWIDDARNLPGPDVEGGPPVLWRDGALLMGLRGGDVAVRGEVLDATPAALPATRPGELVVLSAPSGPPSALRTALGR